MAKKTPELFESFFEHKIPEQEWESKYKASAAHYDEQAAKHTQALDKPLTPEVLEQLAKQKKDSDTALDLIKEAFIKLKMQEKLADPAKFSEEVKSILNQAMAGSGYKVNDIEIRPQSPSPIKAM